jgi:hypothetical protein
MKRLLVVDAGQLQLREAVRLAIDGFDVKPRPYEEEAFRREKQRQLGVLLTEARERSGCATRG